MAINIFILSIIVLSLIVTNVKVKNEQNIIQYKNIPLVTFTNSTLYEINQNFVKNIIKSSQALNYKNRDELYDATIVFKNDYNKTNTLNAQYILKKDYIYKLYQDVYIDVHNENNISLLSDYVEYNEKENVLKNNNEFDLKYNSNRLLGDNLYYDMNNKVIKAQNTHFMLKIKE